jgi:hypothetical protein
MFKCTCKRKRKSYCEACEKAQWDRIYRAKFEDPTYYTALPPARMGSSLGEPVKGHVADTWDNTPATS